MVKKMKLGIATAEEVQAARKALAESTDVAAVKRRAFARQKRMAEELTRNSDFKKTS